MVTITDGARVRGLNFVMSFFKSNSGYGHDVYCHNSLYDEVYDLRYENISYNLKETHKEFIENYCRNIWNGKNKSWKCIKIKITESEE